METPPASRLLSQPPQASATDTGMIPDEMSPESRAGLLAADVIGPPIVFLASAEAEGLTNARIVARD